MEGQVREIEFLRARVLELETKLGEQSRPDRINSVLEVGDNVLDRENVLVERCVPSMNRSSRGKYVIDATGILR